MNWKDKLVYVGQTKRPKQRLNEHINGYCEITKPYIEKMEFIEVETLFECEQYCYALELIWIRILRENHFKVINRLSDLRNSTRIFERYMPNYELRKDTNIYGLCDNKKC